MNLFSSIYIEQMLFQELPGDILKYIWDIIDNNTDTLSLMRTCNYFRRNGKKWGYIKTISFDISSDVINYINMYNKAVKSLKKLEIANIYDPISWITYRRWPRTVIFNNCNMGYRTIDPLPSITESLVIHENRHLHDGKMLHINWCKFPKLRVLDIYTYNIDLIGIENCKELEIVRIDIELMDRILPKCFATFQNLTFLATNMCSEITLHFVSKKLKFCSVPKKQDFTSDSKIIPENHLKKDTLYCNIQCYGNEITNYI